MRSASAPPTEASYSRTSTIPLNPATVSRRFERLVKEAGVPRITLHGTRHTWATLALLEGIPAKVVAEVLGHSSTQVTLYIYSHVTPGMQSDATSCVANLLTGT